MMSTLHETKSEVCRKRSWQGAGDMPPERDELDNNLVWSMLLVMSP